MHVHSCTGAHLHGGAGQHVLHGQPLLLLLRQQRALAISLFLHLVELWAHKGAGTVMIRVGCSVHMHMAHAKLHKTQQSSRSQLIWVATH